MASAKNIESVKLLQEKLAKASSIFFTDYRGMTHKQLESLRKSLKKAQAEYIVAKNTLLKIALKDDKKDGLTPEAVTKLSEQLEEPTATLLTYGEEIAAIKELDTFIKNAQIPKVKIGFFQGALATPEDFKKLASLPTKDILIAMLIGQLKSPLYGLHNALSWNIRSLVYTLDAIKSKKPQAIS